MKSILLITKKQTVETTPFATLSAFFKTNPQYGNPPTKGRIEETLSRKKIAFEDEFFKIERKKVVR